MRAPMNNSPHVPTRVRSTVAMTRSMARAAGQELPALPLTVLGQWAEAHKRGFVMKVPSPLLCHGDLMHVGGRDVASAVHHLRHLADRAPDGKRRNRIRRPLGPRREHG